MRGRAKVVGGAVVVEFETPEGASTCHGCGASGPPGKPDVESCPWCDGSELPADAVRVVDVRPSA